MGGDRMTNGRIYYMYFYVSICIFVVNVWVHSYLYIVSAICYGPTCIIIR